MASSQGDSSLTSPTQALELNSDSNYSNWTRWCLRVSSSPWPAWTMSGLLLVAFPAASRISQFTHLPPAWQLAPTAAAFGLGGYITSTGDHFNGSGTTSAWSFIYLFLHGRSAVSGAFFSSPQTNRRFFPLGVATAALTNAIAHGYVYWSGSVVEKRA
ncbi:hypothetical protein BY996DRAFT_122684 [Phakopsora pachyrhizi]|uniref:Expressed protein n=1 Tax=Phakopsora pachyrhizi TaxID=170000 RepID=A0AAV0BL91_PHAPC|nr:hypothetical protein BY996DRAFT_122684 [Phakopsora pachyrhizi]CAH7688080.1 expressed protein [Phakopsora pachyrhizi]